MKIHFYLRFHTSFGEELQITGGVTAFAKSPGKAIPMSWLNEEFWHASLEIDPGQSIETRYQYQLKTKDGKIKTEWEQKRELKIPAKQEEETHLIDTWNHAGEYENAFYTSPFRNILLAAHPSKKIKQPKKHSHIFKVKAPLLQKNEVVCLTGSTHELGEWDTKHPIQLQPEGNWWTARLDLPKEGFPLHYKYGVFNTKEKQFVRFESGENRSLFGDATQKEITIIHDGFVHLPNNTWRGAGVAIPVFSLRSQNGFGVGEFADIPLLVDWAQSVDMKLIQVLPINDTMATNTWTDSYPYAAISAFALHPLYINLEKVAGKKNASVLKTLRSKKQELNQSPGVDYEEVLRNKIAVLRELFKIQKDQWAEKEDYHVFYQQNKHWLLPYAVFCYLRDKNGTTDFSKWKQHSKYDAAGIEKFASPCLKHHDEIRFHYFVQYHLHLQLKDATAYAHKHGIIVKGDIPIGIYRHSCDAWMAPELYNMNMQAGAPPDDFAVVGQNWGFPTYNWNKMQEDGYSWWKQRFEQMSEYFDAFRIDHILGFFRIWSIPFDAVDGIMGHFVPAQPVLLTEFREKGISIDHIRYTQPYITDEILWDFFGVEKDFIKENFLEKAGNGLYRFRPEFDAQRKIECWFTRQEIKVGNAALQQKLYDLHSNIILIPSGSHDKGYHFRFGMDQTKSFSALDQRTQHQLKELYNNYFYHRQDERWLQEAMKKLPALKASTNMLICGEDLGMVPHCVSDAMKSLGILSLEIQRMPKDPAKAFFHPKDAPYLSVVTPSTHDMSTIRGWWEEDPISIQRFFNEDLGQWGEAPATCEAWINKAVVIQHLNSPAMWSIFQLQDLLGMDEKIRVIDHAAERINIPSNPRHYWRYRMHLNLEDLQKEKSFNYNLKEYIKSSGRAS